METLTAMGFDRRTVEYCLNKNRGNVDATLEELLAGLTVDESSSVEQSNKRNFIKTSSFDFEELIVSEFSQYSFSELGSSSCTPISVNMTSALLQKLDASSGSVPIDFQDVITDATLVGVSSYSSILESCGDPTDLNSKKHMSVEEYLTQATAVDQTLIKIGEPKQLLLTQKDAFTNVLLEAPGIASSQGYPNKYVGVVVTKPPETLAVFIPPHTANSTLNQAQSYYLFDSHSRPQLGITGSYLVKTNSLKSIVERLHTLFPALQSTEEDDNYFSWMYNSFECITFVTSMAQPSSSSQPRIVLAAATFGGSEQSGISIDNTTGVAGNTITPVRVESALTPTSAVTRPTGVVSPSHTAAATAIATASTSDDDYVIV